MSRYSDKFRVKILIVAFLAASALHAAAEAVRLRGEVTVSGEVIRLSDLLPTVPPSDRLRAAPAVILGRSPALGSFRILAKPQVLSQLRHFPALSETVEVPDRIIVRRSGSRIPEAVIREAASRFLREKGLSGDLADGVLQWPEVEASADNAEVEVAGSRWNRQRGGLELSAHCVPRALCKSFLIFVKPPAEGSLEWFAASPGLSARPQREKGSELAHAGERATLLVQDGEVRISVPVTCLQRGRLGEQIRVLDPVARRVFRATVVAAKLLRMQPQGAGKS